MCHYTFTKNTLTSLLEITNVITVHSTCKLIANNNAIHDE